MRLGVVIICIWMLRGRFPFENRAPLHSREDEKKKRNVGKKSKLIVRRVAVLLNSYGNVARAVQGPSHKVGYCVIKSK